jgi:hypothetical protein
VPHHTEVGIEIERLLQGAQCLAIPLQLDQGGSLERQREGRVAELGPRPLGEPQRVVAPPLGTEQLETLGPHGLQIGLLGEQVAVRLLRVGDPSFAGEVAGAGHGPLAWRVREQLVRRGRPHGVRIYGEKASRLAV